MISIDAKIVVKVDIIQEGPRKGDVWISVFVKGGASEELWPISEDHLFDKGGGTLEISSLTFTAAKAED